MSSARKPMKVSGLIASGKLVPAQGVSHSHAFESPADSSAVATAGAGTSLSEMPRHDKALPVQWELMDDRIWDIPTDQVDDSPFQTEDEARERYDPQAIDELAHTMAQAGQQEPITVRYISERFELIAGHRRIRAARSLGWPLIRARIVKRNDVEAEKSVMVHNEGRRENSDFAKALLYARARDKGYVKNQTEIANMFATTQTDVSKRLAMLTLPGPILDLLHERKDLFGRATAGQILKLIEAHPTEINLIKKGVERIKEDGASENSIGPWVAQMLRVRTSSKPARNRKKVIIDPSGRQLYTASLAGKIITLRVHTDEDPALAMDRLVEFFQNSAKAAVSE